MTLTLPYGNLSESVKQLGGSIQKKDLPNAKRIYEISIDAQKLQQLREKLKRIGDVGDETRTPLSQDGHVVVRIEFVSN